MSQARNLYEVLGVGPNATAAEIKKAHPSLVKEHHPDRQGDRAAFERVQRAFEVLSDPERRKRYDETGDDGQSTSDEVDAFLRQMIGAALEAGFLTDPEKNPLATIRSGMANLIKTQKARASVLERDIAKLMAARERVTKSGEGDNLFTEAIDREAEKNEKLRQTALNHVRLAEGSLDKLKAYSCVGGEDLFAPRRRREGSFSAPVGEMGGLFGGFTS